MKFMGLVYGTIIGFFVWLLTFFLTGYIQTIPELYIFPGIITGVISGFLIIFLTHRYLKRYKIKDWFNESMFIGVVITFINFIMNFVLFPSSQETALMNYPLYLVFALFGGYLTKR